MAKGESPRTALLAVPILLLFFRALPLSAAELTVDRRTIQADEIVTITVVLDDTFAGAEIQTIPVQNLAIDGPPSVSSSFEWVNGRSSRRRELRFTAHPRGPGPALVGPLVITGDSGQRETLAPVSIQVLPDATAGSNDPLTILRELRATLREPIFIVAEADKTEVWAGEEIVVTWTIYNATQVQRWGLGDLPNLADFWAEEIDVRNQKPVQVMVGETLMEKLPIRRVALFPLRGGSLTVDGLRVDAAIVKNLRTGDPFNQFSPVVLDVHLRSARLAVDVRPIPPGRPVDVVGGVTLACGKPAQRHGGPVAIGVTMSGRANLRPAHAPRWAQPPDGDVEVEEGKVSVARSPDGVTMTRNWTWLIFPSRSGRLAIPPLVTTMFTPLGERRELRCSATALDVTAAEQRQGAPRRSNAPSASSGRAAAGPQWRDGLMRFLPWIASAIVLAALSLALLPHWRRSRKLRREARAIVRDHAAAEIREAIDGRLSLRGHDPAVLILETTDLGDAYRAVRSLLETAERDRAHAVDLKDEMEARVRELLRIVSSLL